MMLDLALDYTFRAREVRVSREADFTTTRRPRRNATFLLILSCLVIIGLCPLRTHAAQFTARKPGNPPATTRAGKADPTGQSAQQKKTYDIDFKEFKLKNGLRVLL